MGFIDEICCCFGAAARVLLTAYLQDPYLLLAPCGTVAIACLTDGWVVSAHSSMHFPSLLGFSVTFSISFVYLFPF